MTGHGQRLPRPLVGAAAVAVITAAAALPAVVTTMGRRQQAAQVLCLLVAALGLSLAVGDAGLPSLAQGGFMGVAAYTAAVLRVRHHVGPVVATIVAVAVTTAAGLVVAWGVRRMGPAILALTTWVASWAMAIAVGAFPRVTGGPQGLVLGPVRQRIGALGVTVGAGPVAIYEIALAAAVVTALVVLAVRHRYGATLAALREDPSAARAANVPVDRLRRGVLVGSAAIAGVAGALHVQAGRLADPTAYGPLLSAKLLIVVLAGGTASVAGPAVGLVALAAASRLSVLFGDVAGVARARVEPLAVALLLVPVFLARGRGLLRRPLVPATISGAETADTAVFAPENVGGGVRVEGVRVRFGGVQALDGVSLEVTPGTCHTLVGTNGSGKSTLLKVLAGTVRPDAGVVEVDGVVARTVQRLAVAGALTPLQHLVSGAEPSRRTGALRAVLSTPMSRAETAAVHRGARRLLAELGLAEAADRPAAELDSAARRLVQIGRALMADPDVLLLDEPAAGLGQAEQGRLVEVLGHLKARRLTIVLVEHRMGVVEAVADAVTRLDAGVVVLPVT